jgi:hypothetical protein
LRRERPTLKRLVQGLEDPLHGQRRWQIAEVEVEGRHARIGPARFTWRR